MKAKHVKYNNTEPLEINDGVKAKVLLRSGDTNGVLAVFEDIVEAGAPGPPRHIHHKQDETFLFLEGEFELEIEGKRFQTKPGDVAFVPKGTAHAWRFMGTGKGRIRYIFSPALNIEDMFQEINDLKIAGRLGEEEMKGIAQKFPEQELVGPPIS
jgi:uncharacterized cupin superfamily protein